MRTFSALGVNESLQNKLSRQSIKTPTPIQTLTIPSILEGIDILAEAQTGTGKTLAFLVPMFQNFDTNSEYIQGLIIAPTRELAIQVTEEAKKLATDTDFEILALYGGKDIQGQLKKLNRTVTLVVATPGRLIDHMQRETVDLTHLRTLVLDEADQMLMFGFKNEIEFILKKTNPKKQMLCFSATLDGKVKKLAYRYMKSPVEVSVAKKSITLEGINQKVVTSSDRWKQEALMQEMDKANPFLGIIFCRTIRRADKLELELAQKKYNCTKLHGDMTQGLRQRVMKAFKEAKYQYLVTTDVAARGIDITGVTHIFNYDIPETPEIYIHRIGRTGRMGEKGTAITFVSPKDEATLHEIETEIKMVLPREHYDHHAQQSEEIDD